MFDIKQDSIDDSQSDRLILAEWPLIRSTHN